MFCRFDSLTETVFEHKNQEAANIGGANCQGRFNLSLWSFNGQVAASKNRFLFARCDHHGVIKREKPPAICLASGSPVNCWDWPVCKLCASLRRTKQRDYRTVILTSFD